MVRGGSLLILRIAGQRSRSQLLKIEQRFDTFLFPARYLFFSFRLSVTDELRFFEISIKSDLEREC